MGCRAFEGGVICGEQMERVKDEKHGEDRWCFRCRKVREFRFIVMAPVGYSYYEPNPSIRCGNCDLQDGDMFPGWSRTWGDD